MAITREITYFNSFAVKKVVEDNGSSLPGKAVWPSLPWNPSSYPSFPLKADPALVAYDWYIEESRIRGGYNNTQLDLGVRAYITETNDEEFIANSGIIYSGIYNSTTGFNETNVFSTGENIEKQLDPRYGDIQKLFAYDTNLIVFQNDKINRALIDKDALYTASGNSALTSSDKVIGQITPYSGEYGISEDPLSFAFKGYRIYCTDRARGAVLRLSRDGLTEISGYGMNDFFRDKLGAITNDLTVSSVELTLITGNAAGTTSGVFPTNSIIFEDGVDDLSSLEYGMSSLFSIYGNQNVIVEEMLSVGSLTGNLTSSITLNKTGLSNGVYTGVVPTSDRNSYGQTTATGGIDPKLTVGVSGGTVTNVIVTSGSILYAVGDVLTINGLDIGGGASDNVKITLVASNIDNISTTQKRIVFNKKLSNFLGGLAVPPTGTSTFYKNIQDKIIGGFDNYSDKYVLSIQDSSEDSYDTLTFNDDNNSWTSFWDYKPLFMATLNNMYFTCVNAEVWKHYDTTQGNNYNSFYGSFYPSSITFAFNPSVQSSKVFKTIAYEGSNGWNIQSIISDIDGVQANGNSYNDSSAFIYSYDEGSYVENGITYRAGFNKKENKYMCNIINNSTIRPEEVIFGDQISGIKGYYVTVTIQNDDTTDTGGLKSLFSVSSEYVLSAN